MKKQYAVILKVYADCDTDALELALKQFSTGEIVAITIPMEDGDSICAMNPEKYHYNKD
jgi:hypothetical protein